MNRRKAHGAGGFSLVELLVVVAIMSILASVGMPLAKLAQQRTKEEELRRSLRDIRTAIDNYKRLVDEGRIEKPADGSGYPPGLAALGQGVQDAKSLPGTKIYLLRRLPRDPFADPGTDAEETWSLRSYESPPDEPQPGKDVFDVHSKSRQIGFNGIAYNQW